MTTDEPDTIRLPLPPPRLTVFPAAADAESDRADRLGRLVRAWVLTALAVPFYGSAWVLGAAAGLVRLGLREGWAAVGGLTAAETAEE